MVTLLQPHNISFPAVQQASEDGLLAIGGDLSQERLLEAYRSGIFPWFSEYDPICWWSPDPRFVLFPDELIVRKSMQSILRGNRFRFTINKAFESVIKGCKNVYRPDQGGTWISEEMLHAYIDLHKAGYAYSAEAWHNGELVGGLYGIRMGKVFCGESMFSTLSNASKFAFIKFVNQLKKEGVLLIDCQVYTEHLESLGARHVPREEFLQYLKYGENRTPID